MTSPILIEGPWQHRTVHAHGARFHVAIMGEGPLVLLIHGFPTYWWLWRDLMPTLAETGHTVAAMDMRGYGATDHPPRGYDPRTLAADVAGVCRALGFDDCVVIGHGIGGLVAWTAGTLQTSSVRAVGAISAAHPNALRSAMLTDPAQVRALSYVVGLQRPFIAERSLVRDGAAWIGDLLRRWAQPQGISDETVAQYRSAFLVGNTSHCSIEFHRWALRSIPRIDGREFARDMEPGVRVPVLQVHGRFDTSILLSTAQDSASFAKASYSEHVLECGHLIPEVAGTELREIVVAWLASLP